MRIQSKLTALAVISTLAVALTGCLSARSDTVADAAALVIALPIYLAACAGGGCGDHGPGALDKELLKDSVREAEAEQLRIEREYRDRVDEGDAKAQTRYALSYVEGPERIKYLYRAAS